MMTFEEAEKIYRDTFGDLTYDTVLDMGDRFIFVCSPLKDFHDPVFVNKKTKECRGYNPVVDGV